MATVREIVESDGQFSFDCFIRNNLTEILGIIVDNNELVQQAVLAVLQRVKAEDSAKAANVEG
jgi:hypothetical protein